VICEVPEWGTLSDLTLTEGEIAALATSDAFDLRPDPRSPSRWRVTARQFVGVARFGDLEIRVRPKVAVHRLLELLCSSLDRVQWRDEDTTWAESDDLLAVVAGSFAAHAERALRTGLLQGYRTIEDRMLTVRGRIATGRQVSRNPGLPIPVEVTYDDYTTDVIENQLLAGAGRVLLRLPGVPALLRSRLRRLEFQLVDVKPTRPNPNPPDVTWTRLNERYRTSITLARLILRSCAMEDEPARMTTAIGFLIDMNKVFEDVVGQGIREALGAQGFTVELQASHHLDDERRMQIRPDVIIRSASQPVAVADIKYKSPSDGLPPNDVYQAISYATRFDLSRATLIYASPEAVSRLSVGGMQIGVKHVDLSDPPDRRGQAISVCARSLVEPLRREEGPGAAG
jgi:5-methylcytosine-specific restriction enzyme subunit McrC